MIKVYIALSHWEPEEATVEAVFTSFDEAAQYFASEYGLSPNPFLWKGVHKEENGVQHRYYIGEIPAAWKSWAYEIVEATVK